MPRKLLVILVVGLSPRHLPQAPALRAVAEEGFVAPLTPVLPAVTCTVQSTLLTGLPPSQTGIVANGWYFRELAEVKFWLQPDQLVHGPKLWDSARERDPSVRTAKMFWWYNMYSKTEYSVTPRPGYPADGRKVPDIYSEPPELRARLNARLGAFPLFNFWGPTADIRSSQWIVDATRDVLATEAPELALAYLPHLDYNLQRLGPEDPAIAADVAAIDREAGRLIEDARGRGYEIVVLSEYGITGVSQPVHLNRALRRAGLLRTQRVLDSWEKLDCGACRAFAVADHQLAHVYVRDPKDIPKVAELCRGVEGVERVFVGDERADIQLDHPRSGEIICLADARSWFTYYYWEDDALAPDFARTVDIHRKPGYDPVELFFDPHRPLIKGRAAMRLAQKLLGFRYLMDVVSLDASLVKGSHGRLPDDDADGPLILSPNPQGAKDRFLATEVKDFLLNRMFR